MEERKTCDVCHSNFLRKISFCRTQIQQLKAEDVRVTNKDYGKSLAMAVCQDCGLIQPQHLIDPHSLGKLYHEGNDAEYVHSASLRGQSNYRQISRIIKRYDPSCSSFLEVGAGSGTLVSLLKNEYAQVDGIEPNISFCEFARDAYTIALKNVGIEDFQTDRTYDCVVALDVLEHVASADRCMGKIAAMLGPSAIAIIGTPDVESFASRLFPGKWWHIRPGHLYYFHKRSFLRLAAKYNLSLVGSEFFSWELPLGYVVDSIQRLIFGKVWMKFDACRIPLRLCLFDSRLNIVKKG
ncbi:MAG: class I SAM-dependent methyltransferase [Candidatus Omnitrophica bacterium]|nr:class I SAM-dependent methyltransferase [Candidatus Omnitrophota bacterium]